MQLMRDKKLRENGLLLNLEKSDALMLFENKKSKTEKAKKPKSKKNDKRKVDKYIYEIISGKKYRIFIRKGGTNDKKGIYYSEIFEGTLAQAKKRRDLKLAEIKLSGLSENKGNIKFIEFVRLYFKEYAERELSPVTIKNDKADLKNYVLPEIANIPLCKIDVLTIQKIMNKLRSQTSQRLNKNGEEVNLSSKTINNIYGLIRKILNTAVDWDFLTFNPALKVKAPTVIKKEKEYFNRDELMEVLNLLKNEDIITETMFNIAICTGMRRSEILGLHIEDIDFDNNLIHVKRSVVYDSEHGEVVEKSTKTINSVRTIPVPLFCIEIIKEYLKTRERIIWNLKRTIPDYKEIQNLFLGKYGKVIHPDTLTSKWESFLKKNKNLKSVSLHGLRHSYCSMQMNENQYISPSDVKKIMGHSQLSTTFGYTHSDNTKSLEVLSVFDKYYSVSGEMKINFNEIVSLYTKFNFTASEKIRELSNFMINTNDDENTKHEIIKKYIDNKYPIFQKLDFSNINMYNAWDWLETNKKMYGDEFLISQLSYEKM